MSPASAGTMTSSVRMPDACSIYVNFKYRVWFTWYLAQFHMPETAQFWSNALSGADPHGGLWFWEDEDEECIQAFINNRSLGLTGEMPAEDWDNACRALEARQMGSQVTLNPLSHLTPQTRLRFVAWLIIAEVGQKERLLHKRDIGSLHVLIAYWGTSIASSEKVENSKCTICRVSHLLNIWMETMLEVYLPEDLRSIPWDPGCKCFERHLVALAAGPSRATRAPPERDSGALRVLFELIVPPWPLILWVVFRSVVNNRTEPLQTFLDLLCGTDQDIFTWDNADVFLLYRNLLKDGQLGIYPRDWNRYMVDIDFRTWLQIRKMTRTVPDRPRRGPDDLKIRLAAASLIFSPEICASTLHNILAPLHLSLDCHPFVTISQVANPNYKEQTTLGNLDSEEFWVGTNLRNQLSVRSQNLSHTLWCTPLRMSILERVQYMHLALTVLPQPNLAAYAYSLMLQQSDSLEALIEFWNLGGSRHRGFLESLKRYYTDLETLFSLLKRCQWSKESNFSTSHTIAADVHKHMSLDIAINVAGLVLFLQDAESYKQFLMYRGTDAQRLLDLLQDFLDLDSFSVVKPLICKALLRLSRASDLHPRCFPLSELQKVGHQVAAGGFGDIWKGLVGGQSVCVKVMRIFQESDVEAVLKEFGREALIWRQLCHPNLLPFFGLYYLDNRLCLVSPWMENGNVMEFLKKAPSSANRLSLMLDVALGLQYLHEKNVVHGDLKAINILVTLSRRACIADFGLSSISNALTLRFTHSTPKAPGGTARYQAPELFQGEISNHFGSDVYAFACVCYEILTGRVPFHELPNDVAVVFRVANGKRPSRPTSCSGITAFDSLWELLQNCWDGRPSMRPTAPQVVERLVGPLIGATTTTSTTDWDEKCTSKFRRSLQAQALLPSVTQIERMLFGDDVVEESLLGQESPGSTNNKGLLELGRQQLKRPYEECTSDLNREADVNLDVDARKSIKKLKQSSH